MNVNNHLIRNIFEIFSGVIQRQFHYIGERRLPVNHNAYFVIYLASGRGVARWGGGKTAVVVGVASSPLDVKKCEGMNRENLNSHA